MYGYSNYQKVKAAIEERRRAAIAAADARDADVRGESEEIREIDRELVSTGLKLFKAACTGADVAPIKERNIALTARRREVLLSLGYPEDYTLPKYTCKKCDDTGFEGTKMCSCFREMLLKENIKSSGIGSLIEKQSFDNFDFTGYTDEDVKKKMKRTVKQAKNFVDSFGKKPENLLLIGNTGTGKTHVSTSIAKALIESGYEVLYDSAQNIMTAFEQDKFKSGYSQYEPKSSKFLECDLLIIDDLGTEMITQFTVSCLYNLINTRLNKDLSTVISTNLSPEELSRKYDDRIYSRLFGPDTLVLHFVGPDRRLPR